MALYDIAKTQRLMAESKTDKEIADTLFQISKQIVKELAEDFQLTDNDFKILTNKILEFNLPKMQNPLMSWQDVPTSNIDTTIDQFTGEKINRLKATKHLVKDVAKPSVSTGILKVSKVYKSILKSVITNPMKKRIRLMKEQETRNKQKPINESIIKKAIEETD